MLLIDFGKLRSILIRFQNIFVFHIHQLSIINNYSQQFWPISFFFSKIPCQFQVPKKIFIFLPFIFYPFLVNHFQCCTNFQKAKRVTLFYLSHRPWRQVQFLPSPLFQNRINLFIHILFWVSATPRQTSPLKPPVLVGSDWLSTK